MIKKTKDFMKDFFKELYSVTIICIIFLAMLLFSAFFVGLGLGFVDKIEDDKQLQKSVAQESQDYILNYGLNESNYIHFTAVESKTYGGGNVHYTLEDGSMIYSQNGIITWKHENGTIDCYTNGYITSH